MQTDQTEIEAKDGKRPGIGDELARVWKETPNKAVFLVPLALWAALFQFLGNSTFGYEDTPSLFQWMITAYNNTINQDDHGNLIPFVVIGLIWWKRDQLLAVRKEIWWPGLLILFAAVLLHWLGFFVQQPRLSIVAFFGGVYGLMGHAWGPRFLRAAFFPFVLFAFMVPVGSMANALTFPLRLLVTALSVGFSNIVLGIDVLQKGSMIFNADQTYQYDVAPACSGIRSLVSLIILTTIYGVITFRSLWKRWFVVLLAMPLAVVGNTTRIVCVIIAAEAFGQDAGKRIEQNLGFITFAIAIACVLAVGHWLKEDSEASAATTAQHPGAAA